MNQKPTVSCISLIQLDEMDLENLFAFVMVSATLLEMQSPMPFSKSINGIGTAVGGIVSKLQSMGLVSEDRIKSLSIQMATEGLASAKQAVEESNIAEIITEIEKQSETAGQN